MSVFRAPQIVLANTWLQVAAPNFPAVNIGKALEQPIEIVSRAQPETRSAFTTCEGVIDWRLDHSGYGFGLSGPFADTLPTWSTARGIELNVTPEPHRPPEYEQILRAQQTAEERFHSFAQRIVNSECSTNVFNFLEECIPPELQKHAKVLLIYNGAARTFDEYATRKHKIYPETPLFKEKNGWAYHAVLEIGGRIYDFSYSGRPGVPTNVYVAQMFSETQETYFAVQVPAQTFAEKYRHHFEYIYHLGYVPESLTDVLRDRTGRFGFLDETSHPTRTEMFNQWGQLHPSGLDRAFKPKSSAAFTFIGGSEFHAANFQELLFAQLDEMRRTRPGIQDIRVVMHFNNETRYSLADFTMIAFALRQAGIYGDLRFELIPYGKEAPIKIYSFNKEPPPRHQPVAMSA